MLLQHAYCSLCALLIGTMESLQQQGYQHRSAVKRSQTLSSSGRSCGPELAHVAIGAIKYQDLCRVSS